MFLGLKVYILFSLSHLTLAFAWFSLLLCCFLLPWLQLSQEMTQGKHRNLGGIYHPYPGKELETHHFFLLCEHEEC